MFVIRLKQVLKVQASKAFVQMLMVSTPVKMLSAAKHVPIAPWGGIYDQLTEQEMTQDWFTDG